MSVAACSHPSDVAARHSGSIVSSGHHRKHAAVPLESGGVELDDFAGRRWYDLAEEHSDGVD